MSAGIPKNDTNDRHNPAIRVPVVRSRSTARQTPSAYTKDYDDSKKKAVGGTDRLKIISVTIGVIACKNFSICRKVNGAAVSRIRRSMCNSDEAWKICTYLDNWRSLSPSTRDVVLWLQVSTWPAQLWTISAAVKRSSMTVKVKGRRRPAN